MSSLTPPLLSPQGPDGLFTSPHLDELLLVLEDVYAHAVG